MSPATFTLDGQQMTYRGDPGRSLLTWLRDERGVTIAKDGCSGQGFCRACTVEIDGRARLACITAMKTLDGKAVTTLAGLPTEVRDALAHAFVSHGAVQCGFCTPGLIMAVHELLERSVRPSDTEIREELAGNVCRCTGYGRIVDAVQRVSVARGHRPT